MKVTEDPILSELKAIREILLMIANNTNKQGGVVVKVKDDRPDFGEPGSWYR